MVPKGVQLSAFFLVYYGIPTKTIARNSLSENNISGETGNTDRRKINTILIYSEILLDRYQNKVMMMVGTKQIIFTLDYFQANKIHPVNE